MSMFDAVRNRKRGEDAKQRVLDRTYSSPAATGSSSGTDMFAAVRTRSLADPVAPTADPVISGLLRSTLSGVGVKTGQPQIDMSPKPSAVQKPKEVDFKADQKKSPLTGKLPAPELLQTPQRTIQSALADKVPAASLLQQSGRGPAAASQIPGLSQYEINKKEIESAPVVIKQYAQAMNYLTEGNPLGIAIGNAFSGNSGVTRRDSSGNETVDKLADLINNFITPMLVPTGAPVGMGPNVGTYEVAGKALAGKGGQAAVNKIAQGIGKIAPKVSPGTAQTIARQGLTEAVAGPLQGVGIGLANQQDSNEQIGMNALYGLAAGAALGFGGAAAGAGLRSLFRRNGIPEAEITELLALPEGRGTVRQSAAVGRSTLAAGTDPVINPYTYELPEASAGTRTAADNAAGGRSGLREIDQEIQALQTSYEQAVIDEYKLLRQQLDNRGGVQQGALQRTPEGEVIGRTGRQSNNPRWYQEFYASNGKRPTLKELYTLARDRVDNGFADEAGQVASWRERTGYDEQLAGYQQARNTLAGSVRDIDPALRVTDSPLTAKELKDLRRSGQTQRKSISESIAAPPSVEPTVRSEVATSQTPEIVMTTREQMINAKTLNELTQEDIDYLLEVSRDRELPAPVQDPAPLKMGEPILRPGQFDDPSGLGIAAGQRIKPYDSLKTDTRSQLVTRQQKDSIGISGKADRAYTALVDDLHPLQQQDKLLDKLMEEPLKASERIHTLGLASRGADVISKRIITHGLVDSKGEVVGESLKSILKPITKLMKSKKHIYVDFEDYLVNKHAITRFDRGEKVFRDDLEWTPEYGAQKVAEFEQQFPEFKEAADKYYEFNRQLAQSWLVDTGIISQDMLDAWIDKNPFYVPNKRKFSDLEKTGKGFGGEKRGFGNQGNPVKGYQKGGSQRKIISPIEATIENVDAYVKAAKRNGVMQQYVRNIEQAPDDFAPWAEIVKQPEKAEDIKNLLLTDDMEADGIEQLLFRFTEDFDKAMQKTRLDKDNTVRVMVEGEPVHVLIKDKQLLSAVTALGPESAGRLLTGIGKLTNTMKLLTTGNNPVFSLTRNFFRDIPQAYVASKTSDNPLTFAVDLISAAIDIAGRRGAYKDFLNIGGGHASSIAADRDLLRQSKSAVLPQSGLKKIHRTLQDGYENFLNAVEIAPRLSEFKRVTAQGGDLQAALAAAQDLTVNFKRRGALSGEVDKVFPYFNAAVQGLDKTIRTYKDDPVKAIVKSVLAVTLPTLALYAVNHDDPAYKKLSNRVKDAFLMIPKGDGTFIKIAKPQEQGSIFSDIPERLMRLFAQQDPAAFRDFADRMRTTFIPPGIQGMTGKRGVIGGLLGDTILGPGVDVVANESWSGAQVVPGYLQNLSPGLQADAKTTWPARKIGELTHGTPFETSPKNIDYITKQYTGWLGQFGQPLLSSGGDAGYALEQQMVADPAFTNDLSTEFYHYKDKLDQANYNSDIEELPSWYSDGLRKQMAKISKEMSAVRKDMRAVQDDKSLSNKEKRAELRKLQESINGMAERGNDLARDTVPY